MSTKRGEPQLRAVKQELLEHRDWIDESEFIAGLASARVNPRRAVLVDVGSHFGAVTSVFLNMGWSVVAYDPAPANRERFERNVGSHDRVKLSPAAVSDKPAESVSLFTSQVSKGISTLAAFHDSHQPTARVNVVTLAEDLRSRGVANVDFLKIDIEGFDFFALKGFDWTYAPSFVLYEFEDRKTVPLGYSLSDSSSFVAAHGYQLVYSVWEPIVEYGMRHRWRGLFSTPPSDIAVCWGNVLCFRDPEDASRCVQRFGSRSRRVLNRLQHG
mgnify:FL=1